jgi:hypothetical protein
LLFWTLFIQPNHCTMAHSWLLSTSSYVLEWTCMSDLSRAKTMYVLICYVFW